MSALVIAWMISPMLDHSISKKTRHIMCLSVLLLGWVYVSAGAVQSIENEWLKIAVEAENGALEIRPKQGLTDVVLKGNLPDDWKSLKAGTIEHSTLGRGQSLTCKGGSLILYPKLPFAVIASNLHNASDKEIVLNRVPLLPLSVDMGMRAEELVMYGTGTPPVANAPLTNRQASAASGEGSYVWLALAEPMSRNGVVAGWLTHDRSSGVIFTGIEDGKVIIKPRADYGHLAIPPGGDVPMELFAVGLFEDTRLGLEAFADALATIYAIKLPPQPSGHCTWYHGKSLNEKALPALAEFVQKELLPFGYEFIQIDDGWQRGVARNGPAKDFSGYRSPGPYGTEGMKGAADLLKRNGLTPGLWLIPFAGTYDAPEFEKRQHWFVKRDDGKPYVVKWGGSCLDLTHPEVQTYVHDIVNRIVHEWSYSYLKLDGLWTGLATGIVYVNDKYREDNLGNAVFHNPKMTNVEAYRKGLKIVREAAGDKTYILGCNVSQNMRTFGASIGRVDGMRVGPDNDSQWLLRGEYRLLAGVRTGTRNYFMHRRVWHNDPDPVYVRASIPTEHARVICSWAALAGQLTVASENLQKLPPERLDMLRRIMPAHQAMARPVDYFEEPLARIWLVTDTKSKVRREVVGLFNWDDADYSFNYSLKRTGLDAASYVAFDYWENRLVGSIREKFTFTLQPHTCRVLALRPEVDHPQLLSTSRHVTQGMIDVVEEQWDAKTSSLSGVSRVVANDRYELRVVLPAAGSPSTGTPLVSVSKVDHAAGVTIRVCAQEGRLLRIEINAPTSRTVAWHVLFTQAAVAEAADAVTHNVLTVAEKEAGWKLLFDGKTTEGWRGFQMERCPTNGWVVEGECLKRNARGGDLVTQETFLDFELSWEWKIGKKGNSGVKYLVDETRRGKKNGTVSKNALGNEYQMLDDLAFPELPKKNLTAAWYTVQEPKGASPRPIGEFNQSRIVVHGNHGEHWLNGVKVLEYELGTSATAEWIAKSNFKNVPGYAEKKKTPILLQDHGCDVWFRNVKIRSLKSDVTTKGE